MIHVALGAEVAAAGAADLVVRVGAPAASPDEATIVFGVADPALATAMASAIAAALRGFALEPVAPRTVLLRSRRRIPELELAGAIAIVGVTPRNARHLVELVDGVRAAGAIGVQLVWDGADPPRAAVEHHVFAALERARATPGEPPVVLATSDQPAPALCFLVAHRSEPR